MVDHLIESNYSKNFPDAADEFPSPANNENYIDAWLFQTAFQSIVEIEEYLIEFRETIEATLGDNLLGVDGSLVIDIPAARYPAGKTATARDTNLIAGNIAKDITIFGVAGNMETAAGGTIISTPIVAAIGDDTAVIVSPSLTANKPDIAVPTLSSP
jgi:hypothetical protein